MSVKSDSSVWISPWLLSRSTIARWATALEACGVPATGLAGTVAAAAFLADTLDRAQFKRVGFCGLFFPVLERLNPRRAG